MQTLSDAESSVGGRRWAWEPLQPTTLSTHRAPSIQDVAVAAGVSTATVSRVLNSPHLVSAETAERVRQAIEQLDYRPNIFAQGLMTRKSRVLGLALPDIHGEFYSELLRGADAEARKLKYHLLVGTESRQSDANHRSDASGFAHAFGLIDGLAIMITEPNEKLLKEAVGSQLPVVVLDTEVLQTGVDSVLVDNASGMREAVEHLLGATSGGHLYFVGGPRENFDTRRRAETFGEVLKARGITPRAEQIAYGDYSFDWGFSWGMKHLHNGALTGAGPGGIGVLAGNDEIALGVLRAAQDVGVDVPRTLKIVGFDDTRVASLVRPRLSTVRVPLAEVGAAAIDALVRRIEEPTRAGAVTRLATRLIIRESSGG